MSARGIPVQDEYPGWVQLAPVQEGEVVETAPAKRTAKRAAPVVDEAPVAEVPAEPASDE